MKPSFKKLLAMSTLVVLAATSSAHSFTIGYYDSSRELFGFSGGSPYLGSAKQFLVDQGYTLVATNNADAAFLSGVDAFYTGLISSISDPEISAMQDFVDTKGGFLFIQQDYDNSAWHGAAQQILANWGITSSVGTYSNDTGHTTTRISEWVTDPNLVDGFSGSAHSAIDNIPAGFETLGTEHAGSIILGVFDAGAGRSSDVLVATDIDFWSTEDAGAGWNDSRNRALWENIWQSAATQTGNVPDGGSSLLLFGIALAGTAAFKHSQARK